MFFLNQAHQKKKTHCRGFFREFPVMGCAGAKVNAVSAAVGKKVQEHKERARLRKVAKGLGHLAKRSAYMCIVQLYWMKVIAL